MPGVINLSNLLDHTLNEILNHENKSAAGIIMRTYKGYDFIIDI